MKQFKNQIMTVVGAMIIFGGGGVYADTAGFDKAMQPILSEYLTVVEALAADKTNGVGEAAKKIAALAEKLDSSTVTGEHQAHYKNVPAKIKENAKKLADSNGIEPMREALVELSKPMAMWGTMSKPADIFVVFCSMKPGSWLQKKGKVTNPYYGSKMSQCGQIVSGGDDSGGHGAHKGH